MATSSATTISGANTSLAPQQSTFTCFPNLPIELRLKIWELVANVQRNVDIHIQTIYHQNGPTTLEYRPLILRSFFSSPTLRLAILDLNYESRTKGLRFYNAAFTSRYIGPTIWINWSVDRICFPVLENHLMDTSVLYEFVDICRQENLCHLAVFPKALSPKVRHSVDYGSISFLQSFGFLEELFLVVNQPPDQIPNDYRGYDLALITEQSCYIPFHGAGLYERALRFRWTRLMLLHKEEREGAERQTLPVIKKLRIVAH